MPVIPKALLDLGIAAVIVFLFVCAIYLILLIIKAVKMARAPIAAEVFLNGSKRAPCAQGPVISGIVSNQVIMIDAIKEIKNTEQKLTENAIKQTLLLERVADIQETIGQCMTRMDARDAVKRRG